MPQNIHQHFNPSQRNQENLTPSHRLKIPKFVSSDSACKIDFGDASFLLCFAFQAVLLCSSHAHDISCAFSLQWGAAPLGGEGEMDVFRKSVVLRLQLLYGSRSSRCVSEGWMVSGLDILVGAVGLE